MAERALNRCEYCLLHEEDSYLPHQIDHIISRKHGGLSTEDNLAYACIRWNAWKGSNVASFHRATNRVVALFHPRQQRWAAHFRLKGALIEPLRTQAEVTARLLKLNIVEA